MSRRTFLIAVGTIAALLLPAAPAAALPWSAARMGASTGPASIELPAPAVLSARALPGTLPAEGGTVEVVGKARWAATCRLAVLADPQRGPKAVRVSLPEPATCADGSYREPVSFGPNGTKFAVVVKLGLFASSARGVFYVVVRGH